jgi:hypothetical protein
MIELKRALAATGLLVGIVMVSNAQAEPPPGKGPDAPGHGPGKPGNPAKGPDAHKGPDAKATDAKGSEPGKGADAKGGQASPGAKGAPGAEPAAAGEGRPGMRPHSELRALRDELKAGKLKKADLETRLSKLRENSKERRDNHRAALKARWGEHLAKADTQNELAVHERRMAKLNRLLLLAQTERTGKDAEKLSERVEKLIELETTRHEKRMAQITSGAGAAPAPVQSAAVNSEVAK